MAVIVGAEKMSILSICLVFQFAKFISFIYLKTDVIIEREREREIESSFPEWKKYENLSFGSILLYLEWIKIFHYETCSEIHFYLLNNFRERERERAFGVEADELLWTARWINEPHEERGQAV